tara:strand:- start:384 stop:821 length:438 start_codon:yes stop_codon:yes gene_type:complete
MARLKQRAGRRGFGLVISTDAVYPSTLGDLKFKLKKNRPIWDKLEEELTGNPQNFEKPDRFIDDRMPLPGPRGKNQPPAAPWFGGGYEGRLRLKQADKKVKVTSNRPYVPLFSDTFIDSSLIHSLLDYWLNERARYNDPVGSWDS